MRTLCTAALTLCLVAVPSLGAAQHCPSIEGGSAELSAVPARERLQFIQARIRDQAHRARIWSWTWGSIYATTAAVNLAITPLFDDEQARNSRYVAAGAAAVGVISIVANPLTVMADQITLDAVLARRRSVDADCGLLATAEYFLERGARSEAFGRSWVRHVGGIGFNAGVALTLGFGFDQWLAAGIAFGAGVLLSELMIFTQPVGLIDDLARYRAGQFTRTRAAPPPQVALGPIAGHDRYGLQLGVTF